MLYFAVCKLLAGLNTMVVTRDEVRQIARLARIDLTDEELDVQTHHISALLEHFAILQELDLQNVEPTARPFPLFNVVREDIARTGMERADLLANAPSSRDGCFVVPRVLDV